MTHSKGYSHNLIMFNSVCSRACFAEIFEIHLCVYMSENEEAKSSQIFIKCFFFNPM